MGASATVPGIAPGTAKMSVTVPIWAEIAETSVTAAASVIARRWAVTGAAAATASVIAACLAVLHVGTEAVGAVVVQTVSAATSHGPAAAAECPAWAVRAAAVAALAEAAEAAGCAAEAAEDGGNEL